MIQFQQSETTAERRRWILVLVDSTDGVTGKTGQTGTVFISKNGGAGVASANSIVEVDAGDMPGHYYVELTAAELDTLGWVSISYKAANTLAFHDRAIVSYNDPYMSVGGFSGGGSSSGFRLTDKHIELIAKKVWEYKIDDEFDAKYVIIKAAEHPVIDLSDIREGIRNIELPELDLTSVMDRIDDMVVPIVNRIDNIVIPKPFDHTKLLEGLDNQIKELRERSVDTVGLAKSVNGLKAKMDIATEEINSSLGTVSEIKDGFADLKELTYEFGLLIKDMSDMDKRFEGMTSTMQKKELTALVSKLDDSIKKLLVAVTESKFDILEEINNK